MKRMSLAISLLLIMYTSCRQEGGPVTLTCKPTVLNIPGPQYDFFYHHRRNALAARIGWDSAGKPVTMDCLTNGQPDRQYRFVYDSSENLVRVEVKDVQDTAAPSLVFRWPAGAHHSEAKECWVTLGNDPELHYQFNGANQLQAIQQGEKSLAKLYYDETGNLVLDSLFDVNGAARSYFQYDKYDSKANPGLTHRTFQLFLQMYSRNNPTEMSRNLIAIGISPTGVAKTYEAKGEYTYNEEGLPLTFGGTEYAQYSCPAKQK